METKDYFVGYADRTPFRRINKTENYVEIPPAYIITDERGDAWTLGHEYLGDGRLMEFSVVRNDVSTDEFASKIVFTGGKVKIFGKAGWRTWNGRAFI